MQRKTILGWLGLAAAFAALLWMGSQRPGTQVAPGTAAPLQVEADCDSARAACRAQGDDLAIELRLGPALRPLESFDIELRVLRGVLDAQARIEVEFQMRDMDMGLNRYRLERSEDGFWQGRAVLPVCTTGRSDWVAVIGIEQDGRRWIAEMPFGVGQP